MAPFHLNDVYNDFEDFVAFQNKKEYHHSENEEIKSQNICFRNQENTIRKMQKLRLAKKIGNLNKAGLIARELRQSFERGS